MDTIDEVKNEVNIEIDSSNNNNSTSSLDGSRIEEAWTHENQKYFIRIIEKCKISSRSHGVKGRRYKKTYQIVSIPLISLPIIMSSLSAQLTEYIFISSLFMLVIGLMNTITAFLNHGGKSQKHLEYESRYSELGSDINIELIKKKRFRVAFDLFLEKTRARFSSLNRMAPLL